MSKGPWRKLLSKRERDQIQAQQIEAQPEMSTVAALLWLSIKAEKNRVGKNPYKQLAQVIRNLMTERNALQRKLDKAEAEIARLTAPKTITPFETEGQGQWDVDGDPNEYGD